MVVPGSKSVEDHSCIVVYESRLSHLLQLQRNDWDTASGYSHAVQTMMLMVLKQASGRPWGDHGLFLRYHIEAATIKGINSFRQYKTDATTIGRSVPFCRRDDGAVLFRQPSSVVFTLQYVLSL